MLRQFANQHASTVQPDGPNLRESTPVNAQTGHNQRGCLAIWVQASTRWESRLTRSFKPSAIWTTNKCFTERGTFGCGRPSHYADLYLRSLWWTSHKKTKHNIKTPVPIKVSCSERSGIMSSSLPYSTSPSVLSFSFPAFFPLNFYDRKRRNSSKVSTGRKSWPQQRKKKNFLNEQLHLIFIARLCTCHCSLVLECAWRCAQVLRAMLS